MRTPEQTKALQYAKLAIAKMDEAHRYFTSLPVPPVMDEERLNYDIEGLARLDEWRRARQAVNDAHNAASYACISLIRETPEI